MKTIQLIAAVAGILLAGVVLAGVANADYQCISHDQQAYLDVFVNTYERTGVNTTVIVENSEATTTLKGCTITDEGSLFSQKVVGFFSNPTECLVSPDLASAIGSLIIVKQPKFCGRGSCDHGAPDLITAKLALGDTTTHFTCSKSHGQL